MRRLSLGAVAALLALGTACSTLSSLHGARTLAPGQAQASMALSLQRGANPLSYSGIPIPQVELVGRVGISEDFDVGARAYLLGVGVDGRYRFYHSGPLHLAVSPTLSGFWVPLPGLARQGSVEVQAPLTAEVELAPWISVAGGTRLVLRDQFNGIRDPDLGTGSASRLDAFAGGAARVELHPGLFVLGLSGDLYGQPARHGGPAWAVGLDVGLRTGRRPR